MPAEETGIAIEQTPLDAAWQAARAAEMAGEDAGGPEGDVIAARFIDMVLNEPLICPVWEDEAAGAEAAHEDEIAPKMIERDGVDTLLLFDTEERLSAYIEEPSAFVALPGRVFFDLARGQGAQIALNLDVAPSSTVFSPETVDAIAELMEAADETLDVAADAPLEVGSPKEASEALLAALSARLAAARSLVRESWLFSVAYPGEGGRTVRHLVLGVMAVGDADERELRTLAGELARLGGVLLDDAMMDVAYLVEDERLLGLARRYGVGIGSEAQGRDAEIHGRDAEIHGRDASAA